MGPYLTTPNKEKHPEDDSTDKVSSFFHLFSFQTKGIQGCLSKILSRNFEAVYFLHLMLTLFLAMIWSLQHVGMEKHTRRFSHFRSSIARIWHPVIWSLRWSWGLL